MPIADRYGPGDFFIPVEVERLRDERPQDVGVRIGGGEHQDNDRTKSRILLDAGQHFETRQSWHVDIEQYEVWPLAIWCAGKQYQRFLAARCVDTSSAPSASRRLSAIRGRLLAEGPAVISVYADASFAETIGTGAWAFSVPAFQTLQSGVGPASNINCMELAAAVYGIQFVTSIDLSGRPLALYTDSEVVLRVMECVRTGAALPNRPSYKRVRNLYREAARLTASRSLAVAFVAPETAITLHVTGWLGPH